MSFTDFIVPVLGFVSVIVSAFSLKEGISGKKIAELIVGLLIMGFSIWVAIGNSEAMQIINNDNSILQGNVDNLSEMSVTDSAENSLCQNYLRDTFGIERRGDRPVRVYFDNSQKFYQNACEVKSVSDSINYDVQLIGNTL